MTNHVHLLATPQTDNGISRMMQSVGRRYVRYFNHAYRRTGTLWEGRFKACLVDSGSYFLACQRYIELNPVRAGMVAEPSEYRWSSYHANGLGVAARLWTPHDVYLRLGSSAENRRESYRNLFRSHLDCDVIADVRSAINKGKALGSKRFKDEIERLTGRRQTSARPGPKPKGDRACDEQSPGLQHSPGQRQLLL